MTGEKLQWQNYVQPPQDAVLMAHLEKYTESPQGQAWLVELGVTQRYMQAKGYDYQKLLLTTEPKKGTVFALSGEYSDDYSHITITPVINMDDTRDGYRINTVGEFIPIPEKDFSTFLHEADHAAFKHKGKPVKIELAVEGLILVEKKQEINDMLAYLKSSNSAKPEWTSYQQQLIADIGLDEKKLEGMDAAFEKMLEKNLKASEKLRYASEQSAVKVENQYIPPDRQRAHHAYLMGLNEKAMNRVDKNDNGRLDGDEIGELRDVIDEMQRKEHFDPKFIRAFNAAIKQVSKKIHHRERQERLENTLPQKASDPLGKAQKPHGAVDDDSGINAPTQAMLENLDLSPVTSFKAFAIKDDAQISSASIGKMMDKGNGQGRA